MAIIEETGSEQQTARRILTVAWMAILLGFGVQVLVLAAKLGTGAKWPGAAVLADFAQGISWGLLVCLGVVFGMLAPRSRAAIAGLLGLISGPLAWGAAKGVQRAVQALVGAPLDQINDFFYLLCAVKGVEYLVLGIALGHLSDRALQHMRPYLLAGLCVGILATVAVVGLNLWHASVVGPAMPPAKIAALLVSELVFPIGCAFVIYASLRLKSYAGL